MWLERASALFMAVTLTLGLLSPGLVVLTSNPSRQLPSSVSCRDSELMGKFYWPFIGKFLLNGPSEYSIPWRHKRLPAYDSHSTKNTNHKIIGKERIDRLHNSHANITGTTECKQSEERNYERKQIRTLHDVNFQRHQSLVWKSWFLYNIYFSLLEITSIGDTYSLLTLLNTCMFLIFCLICAHQLAV